jgi:hypothetical protein
VIRGRGRSRPISYSTTRAGARDGRHKTPPDDDDTDSAISRRSSSCRGLTAPKRTRERRRFAAARDVKGGQPRIGAVSPSSAPLGAKRSDLGDVDQGREMTVPVAVKVSFNVAQIAWVTVSSRAVSAVVRPIQRAAGRSIGCSRHGSSVSCHEQRRCK